MTGLREPIHMPAVIGGVEVKRRQEAFLKLMGHHDCEKDLADLTPNRSFKPSRQNTYELLFDGAAAFTTALHVCSPYGPRNRSHVNPGMPTISMVFAGHEQLDREQRWHRSSSLVESGPPRGDNPAEFYYRRPKEQVSIRTQNARHVFLCGLTGSMLFLLRPQQSV
jgi:hypothetical protein